MIVYKCDKCRKEIKDVYTLRVFKDLESVDNPTKGIAFHLCKQCLWDVRNFIFGELPTVDVREVTLCKNCKSASPYWIEGTIFCEDSGCPNLEDGFCNHAEPICEV